MPFSITLCNSHKALAHHNKVSRDYCVQNEAEIDINNLLHARNVEVHSRPPQQISLAIQGTQWPDIKIIFSLFIEIYLKQ